MTLEVKATDFVDKVINRLELHLVCVCAHIAEEYSKIVRNLS